ncbi:MAG TPA: dihydrolipoamide acetyltransferase family protein [Candidatus Binatia bacterium]|jgi:pyruvate dehydrogenase E2 component (dihydrolipoamide acetyltransferase)
MAIEVIMPALGMAQEKGTLVNWLKAEGDSVEKGEPLMEVETDKAAVEIEAPASGILANVTAHPGDEIPVGQKIAVILSPGETGSTKRQAIPALHEHPLPRPPPEGEGRGEGRPAKSRSTPSAKPAEGGGKVPASPAAKRIAKEKNINLASLKGSGPDGSVVAEDVLRAGGARAKTSAPAGPPRVKETIQPTAMRRIVGERMSKSKQSAPHFYLGIDVDMTAVEQRRSELKKRGEKVVPSINDFILSAAARTLRDFPSLNSAYTEKGIQIFADVNIGVAVALEEGLVVPVIRSADRLSLTEMAKQSRELAEKAQKKKLFPLDYEGGTFTVSNLGMLGVDSFIAIINPPQCAILAVGRVAPRAVPQGDKIVARSMMTMTLSADHRIVDGAIAARFLSEVKRLLEKPEF